MLFFQFRPLSFVVAASFSKYLCRIIVLSDLSTQSCRRSSSDNSTSSSGGSSSSSSGISIIVLVVDIVAVVVVVVVLKSSYRRFGYCERECTDTGRKINK